MSVGEAEEAESLKTSLGVLDKTPLSYQTVGGASDVTTGLQKLNKLVGCKVVKNQYVNVTNTASTSWAGGTYSISSSKITVVCNASESTVNGRVMTNNIPITSGHKYLFLTVGLSNDAPLFLYDTGTGLSLSKNIITTAANNAQVSLHCYKAGGFAEQTTYEFYMYVIDLTQRYGNNNVVNAIIGNDSATQVSKLIAFDNNILKDTTHDTGSFSSCKSAKLKTIDYNQWDEEWVVGGYDGTTGQVVERNDRIRSKNLIRIIPNTAYYFSNSNLAKILFYDINENFLGNSYVTSNQLFTTPTNAFYLAFDMLNAYGTTYNNDISIFLYWDGSRIGHEPYKEHIIDLPNVDLNGILKVDGNGNVYADGDELTPDGSGNSKRYDIVDLGTLNWTYADEVFYSSEIANAPIPKQNGYSSAISVLYSNYVGSTTDLPNKSLAFCSSGWSSTKRVVIKDTSYNDAATFKSAMSGKYLIYELATPTTLTADTFSPNFYGDDFGTMQFLDENDNIIDGLQGNEIFYKANIAGFAESVYAKVNGDPNDLAVQSDLVGYEKVVDVSDQITDIAGLTYTIKKAYKIGNIVFLTIRAKNETGEQITANTTLFTLASGLYNSAGAIIIPVAYPTDKISIASNGNVSCEASLNNNNYLIVAVSYAVA